MLQCGSRRSTYCFRHTEDDCGHVNPVKNAEQILHGLPGWEPITAG